MKKIFFLISLGSLLMLLVGCKPGSKVDEEEDDPDNPFDGIYVLQEYFVDSFNSTSQYIYYTLQLKADGKGILKSVDAYGLTEQTGDYTYTEDEVELTIGIRVYNFIYDKELETLTYEGRINRKEVKMSFKFDESFKHDHKGGGVSFEAELFGDDLEENFYNYAPTIMMEGNNIMHIWYCSNQYSGNVTDFVAYRKGTLNSDGTWTFTEKELLMAPTVGTWDARHVCDPSVVAGAFLYKGTTYKYLMAYLGCVTNDSSRNEVGIAVAESPLGPWIKVDEVNPIANYYTSVEYTNDVWTWGYGQPSLVSVDEAGQVLLFYTKGVLSGTYEYVEHWDLSNLDDPKKLHEKAITNAGVMNAQGGSDVINNADFAYDPVTNRIYVIKEDFPYPTDGGLDWLTGTNTIMYMNMGEDDTFIGETLFTKSNLRWNVIGSIGKNETGFARVHNAGILTNEYGRLMNPHQIPIVYTMSDLVTDHSNWNSGGQWPALHTYRLHGYLFTL